MSSSICEIKGIRSLPPLHCSMLNNVSGFASCSCKLYTIIWGTRQARSTICGIDHGLGYHPSGLPVPLLFILPGLICHKRTFFHSRQSFFSTPWLTIFEDSECDTSEFSCDSATCGFFGLSSCTEAVVVLANSRVVESCCSRGDKEGHLEHLVSLDGHLESGLNLSGLPDNRIKADVADKTFRRRKAVNIPYLSEDRGTGDSPQSWDSSQWVCRKFPIQHFGYFPVQLAGLGKEFQDSDCCPFDYHTDTMVKVFLWCFLCQQDNPSCERISDSVSVRDLNLADFRDGKLKHFIRRCYLREQDEHPSCNLYSEVLLVTREIDSQEIPEAILEFGGFLLEGTPESGKLFEGLLGRWALYGWLWRHLCQVACNHICVKFVCLVDLKVHFLELLEDEGVKHMDVDCSWSCGVQCLLKSFVEIRGCFHPNRYPWFCCYQGGGSNDRTLEVSDTVRGVREGSVPADRSPQTIQVGDIKACFTDINSDEQFIVILVHKHLLKIDSVRQRGSSYYLAWLILPNCAVMPQDIIKAHSRVLRRHPPFRGHATVNMKAYSSSPRHQVYQNSWLNGQMMPVV